MDEIKVIPILFSEIREFKDVTSFDEILFDKVEELITKVNEIVEVINSLERDDSLMTPVQERD